ncbi:helix-turn-helix domain-containing protein [Candidatus Thiodictyon syntrophicum]|uniref:Helix-turn-helix domain-containing protein n=1 Tax=Candidatus Thiodictyon syntrophicum TaxID=1166950 RepID=A0A2K8U9D5_9GAMM|nr:hypothetical protein THSYN_15445 [Candidatus Thiodictyon syntrophicum]
MQLTLEQAAERLGKSVRQVRYLIQSGVLPAAKTGGRWLIAAAAFSFPRASSTAVKSSLTSSPAWGRRTPVRPGLSATRNAAVACEVAPHWGAAPPVPAPASACALSRVHLPRERLQRCHAGVGRFAPRSPRAQLDPRLQPWPADPRLKPWTPTGRCLGWPEP